MRRKAATVALTAAIAISMSSTAFAAGWQKDDTGWWWQNDNGSYPSNAWQWVDGNHDGVAECYYFDGNGYMLANTTTPDGCIVNADGAWTVDGVVQTSTVQDTSSGTTSNNSSISGYYKGTTGTTKEGDYSIYYGYVVTELADGSISVLNDGFDGLQPTVYTKVSDTMWVTTCADNPVNNDVIMIEEGTLTSICDTYEMAEYFVKQ